MIITNINTGAELKVNYYPKSILTYIVERTEQNKGKPFTISYKELGDHFQRSESWACRWTAPLIKLGLVEWNKNGQSQSTTAKAFTHYKLKDY